jgi:small-conductance mechanosensitive channel
MRKTLFAEARPQMIRAIVALLGAVAGTVIASQGDVRGDDTERVLAIAGAVLVLVGGIAAVRALSSGIRRLSGEHLGDARAAPLGLIVTVVGYLLVLIVTLETLRFNLRGLLLGGAITGVVLGIAAQQVLANFFAGIVILANRPFVVGEHVVMRSGPLGGEYEGRVTNMSLFYVDLETASGPVALPNAGVLTAAIGPGARAPKDEPDEEEDQQVEPGAGGAPDHSRSL